MKFEAAWHRTKANYGQVSISHRAHLPSPLQHHWRALTKQVKWRGQQHGGVVTAAVRLMFARAIFDHALVRSVMGI
jgi:hypothetical protein